MSTDGSVEVAVDEGVSDPDAAADALRWGWGEPLAHIRLGRRIVGGSAMVDDAGRALLITGALERQTRMMLELRARGWRLAADSLSPIDTAPSVVVHPRHGPWIASLRVLRDAGVPDEQVLRPGTTAVVVDCPSVEAPAPVVGCAVLSGRAANGPAVVSITGHARLRPEFGMVMPWEFGERVPPSRQLADDLALARIPLVQVHGPEREPYLPGTVDELIEWWASL